MKEKTKKIFDFLNTNKGLILNLIGTILVLVSIGKIPCVGSTECAGKVYKFAYILHPFLLRLGLIIMVIGFIFQFHNKSNNQK